MIYLLGVLMVSVAFLLRFLIALEVERRRRRTSEFGRDNAIFSKHK
jgi:hypothetical protein